MTNEKAFHTPVMTEQVLEYLLKDTNREFAGKLPMYIDATVGGGGHAEKILENIGQGVVIGLDWDQDAIDFAKSRLSKFANLYLYKTSYTEIDKIAEEFSGYYVQGVLFDLGVSHFQITTPSRGFSFNTDAPLDMRFDQSSNIRKAIEIIRRSSLPEIRKILSEYGEERYANKIAKHIYEHRSNINTTLDLVRVINEKTPVHQQIKTLARIFQALRIAVNNELVNIQIGLEKAIQLLVKGARIVVISYHSLEDRIAKQTFRQYTQKNSLKILTKKPLRPSRAEVLSNLSSRSALLRAAEKI